MENEKYALGTHLICLAQNAKVNINIRDRAAPFLRKVTDICHESIYLTARVGDFALYIYAIESPRRLMARTAVGDKIHLHCTANGKAILAFIPEEEAMAILSRRGLPQFTSNTITDIEILKKDIEETRKRGFSVDNQEHEWNTYCIGAPIFNDQAHVIGACSISGTDPEIIQKRMPELSNLLRHATQEISGRMGYVPSSPNQIVYPEGSLL